MKDKTPMRTRFLIRILFRSGSVGIFEGETAVLHHNLAKNSTLMKQVTLVLFLVFPRICGKITGQEDHSY